MAQFTDQQIREHIDQNLNNPDLPAQIAAAVAAGQVTLTDIARVSGGTVTERQVAQFAGMPVPKIPSNLNDQVAMFQGAANDALGTPWNREGKTFWADDSQYYMKWDEGSQQYLRADSPGAGGKTWVDPKTGIEMRDTGSQSQMWQSTLAPNYTKLQNGNAGITVNGQVKDTGYKFNDVPASFKDYLQVVAVFGTAIAGSMGINALTAGAGTGAI